MNIDQISVFGWTDSTVALSWIKEHPSKWTTFVANRVSEIYTVAPNVNWRHVPGVCNPADCLSRGMTPKALIEHNLWWSGPDWLQKSTVHWPIQNSKVFTEIEINNVSNMYTVTIDKDITPFEHIINSSSSWPKLLRIITYCFRFITNCKKPNNSSNSKVLEVKEMEQAKSYMVKKLQQQYFSEELQYISRQFPLKKTSKIKSLNPFIDKDGVLRVGERLNNAPIPWDAKHPIILTKDHLVELIIRQTHLRCLHGGVQSTLFLLRQNFWVIGGKNLVRKIIHECVICIKQSAKIQSVNGKFAFL